jgi:hypothetical protein
MDKVVVAVAVEALMALLAVQAQLTKVSVVALVEA